ncbi:MAG: sodium-dependent transporter [Ruminococcaceae bacterium]|nr:sodium-dependent transporter [Oscillospiraceae bacterium]
MGNEKRSSFTGKIGFVLAAAGSAVGLGNIWRFPYLAAQYGGGIFLLTYLVLAVTFGFALMSAEIALGRKTGLSVVGAFAKLNKKYSFVGYLAALVPAIILPYYSVIGGWVMKYMFAFATENVGTIAGASYFGDFIGSALPPIGWFAIFIGLTALIVLFGVEKGIEKVSKIMMPILIVLTIGISIFVITRPGAGEGVYYYLVPDFSKFSIKTVLGAMGQLFYSMSLAMGIMVTYGSYMKKDVSIEKSVSQIEIFDTGIAFLAGLMVVPGVFAFGTAADIKANGPGLMFGVLPRVFENLGTAGQIVGLVFFLMVFFAALTSSISLMETVVSVICDKFKLKRIPACLCVFVFCMVVGLPSCFGFSIWSAVKPIGMDILTFFDFITNNVMMPIVAFFTCIFVGYVIKPKAIIEEVELTGRFKRKSLFTVVIKYIAPICIVLILVSSVLNALSDVVPALKMFKI